MLDGVRRKQNPKQLVLILTVTWDCLKIYNSSHSYEVQAKTSPPTPLPNSNRGDKAQLYRGEVHVNLTKVRSAIIQPGGAAPVWTNAKPGSPFRIDAAI